MIRERKMSLCLVSFKFFETYIGKLGRGCKTGTWQRFIDQGQNDLDLVRKKSDSKTFNHKNDRSLRFVYTFLEYQGLS